MLIDPELGLQGSIEHWDKYQDLMVKLGQTDLEAMVGQIVKASGQNLSEAYYREQSLNSIELAYWDRGDARVRQMVSRAKQWPQGGWSLANSGCVLKHTAHVMLGHTRPTELWELTGQGKWPERSTDHAWLWAYLLKIQPFSTDYALKHGGWKIEKVAHV